jgi:inner membrane protein
VGGISWLYPFVDYDLSLFTVPATRDFWVWSFVFHWSFLLEITIVVAALVELYKHRRSAR